MSPPGLQRAVRTLVLTDLVDSTALVQRLGDVRAADAFARVDRLTRDLLAAHGGQEIDRTDGFLLAFERPVEGVAFALALHRGLAALSDELGMRLAVRAGVHVGDVILRANDAADVARGAKPVELEGLAKPLAARVMTLAGAGQTLLSSSAFELARAAAVGDARFSGVRWASHGDWQLKGVGEAVRIHEATEGTPRPPVPSDKVRPAGERAPRWGLRVGLGLGGIAVLLLASWLGTRPAAEGRFTVHGAPARYDDPVAQEHLDRVWRALLDDDFSRAHAALAPLLELRPVPVELPYLYALSGPSTVDPTTFRRLAAAVEPDALAGPSAAAACLRYLDGLLAMAADTVEPDAYARQSEAFLAEVTPWLDQHPDDALGLACAGNVIPDVDAFVARVERLDPTRATPFVVSLATFYLDGHGRWDASREWVERALEVRPDAPPLLAMRATHLARAGESDEALAHLERALEGSPTRLDFRMRAVSVALDLGRDDVVGRQLGMLLSQEWPDSVRRNVGDALVIPLLRHGRPVEAVAVVGAAQAPLMGAVQPFSNYVLYHRYFPDQALEPLAAAIDAGARVESNRMMRSEFDALASFVELQRLLRVGADADEVERALRRFERVDWGGFLAGPIAAAWAGDPEPYRVAYDAWWSEAQAQGDDTPLLRGLDCVGRYRIAAMTDLAGQRARALEAYADLAADPSCEAENSRAHVALAAGELALDALERGAGDEAARWVARYHERWPTAEPDLPIAQALAAVGVLTGPRRVDAGAGGR
jgi:class 3 adenylate cyclase/tetratricopeptide (TPR) repeat protein